MMKYALIYGAAGGILAVTLITLTMVTGVGNHSLWLGYLVMLLALSLIFVGVKRYRDVECGGVVRFGRAFFTGLSIALVAAILYALGWELYLTVTGYDFMADYSAGMIKEMHAHGASQAAINAKVAELNAMAESYRNPLLRFAMTFGELFPVGLLISLVSAALLRNSALLPARR